MVLIQFQETGALKWVKTSFGVFASLYVFFFFLASSFFFDRQDHTLTDSGR